ncbi:MFS transporter [Exophiala viscosa]|uniref:MFS transporter n=1 Tax=Exophiala viscosa TaxID=2486360 RepID=A0AAN6IF81_9EURO|nr:MFS transporter [Exophiala viscosa]
MRLPLTDPLLLVDPRFNRLSPSYSTHELALRTRPTHIINDNLEPLYLHQSRTVNIPSPRRNPESSLHHRSHSSRSKAELQDKPDTLPSSAEKEKDESYRRLSHSSATGSDDFSLFSDTGDLAEQLTNDEDPYRIELDPLTREGQRRKVSGHGGGRKKRVGFKEQHHLEKGSGPFHIDKESIFIPDPPPHYIPKAERLLALIMAPNDPESARSKGLVGKPLLYFTSVFVSLGVFLFGYDQGVMSGIITGPFFRDYFHQPSPAEIGTMVAILEIGALIASLCVGRIGDIIGRRRTILYGSMVFFVGGMLQTFANGMPMMMIGRFIAGLGVGALSTIVPVYQSEISPPHNRGKLACIEFTGNIVGYAASVWVDYFCSYIESDYSWRTPLLMQCGMGALLGFGSLIICESPRWLLDNDHDEEGIIVIAKFYGKGDIHSPKARQEYREIKMNVLIERQEGERSYADMFKRYRKRVFIAMSAQAFAQLNGINVISYYAPLVFESAGWVGRDAILMTGINAISYLASTIPPWYLVDKWGRRPILLSGAVAMIISLSLISYFIFIDVSWTPALVVVFVMIYNASFGASWGPIPWLYPPEILPLSIRAKGASLSTASNWAFNFVVGELTPVLQGAIKWRLYLVHAFFCAVSFVLVYFVYPETANVRLEDMNALFGDATTAMPTPATQAERGSLMGVGSPSSLDIRGGTQQPGMFSADNAIPGLDIDPPHIDLDSNGQPRRGRSESNAEGLGGWIGRMVSRSRQESNASRGQYGKIGQDEEN